MKAMEPELGKLGFGKMNSSLESSDLEKGKQAWEARFQIGEASLGYSISVRGNRAWKARCQKRETELRKLGFMKGKPSLGSSVPENVLVS